MHSVLPKHNTLVITYFLSLAQDSQSEPSELTKIKERIFDEPNFSKSDSIYDIYYSNLFTMPPGIVFDQIMYLQAFSGMGLHFLKVEYV